MNDQFSLLPIRDLLKLTLNHLDNKKAFLSIPEELFFKPQKTDGFRFKRFGQLLENPLGVAAGPHTQLSQNIVAAWLAGARYIELKTVQTLDEIEVSKPCIDMQDEGYNCEWSQELKLQQSFEQYLDAWIVIHVLRNKLGFPQGDTPGFIFNMSVGYDFKGIMNENVQWFLDKMTNSPEELQAKIKEISDIYPEVENLNISSQMTDNITLSTMHGCPANEIQQIAEYLITERGLHTTVKLNPTLLGKHDLSEIINNSGFETEVPDIAFEHDLKYPDALEMIKSLTESANKKQVFFGLKLTNTLETVNNKEIFGSDVDMMYASGKILHPISINVARKLQNEFSGKLDLSFSGGADAFNTENILKAGLYPVTVSSDLLKPGGYGRLAQYLQNIQSLNYESDFSRNKKTLSQRLDFLNKYADSVKNDDRYKRKGFDTHSIKTETALEIFDCAFAPCESTCPTNQDIPAYMHYTAKGHFAKAYNAIMKTNPFPNTTGMVCDHLCTTKCTRINYDEPLKIREIKRFIAEEHNKKELNAEFCASEAYLNRREGKVKVAIIGAGPSGLSCAYFLNKADFDVTIYEKGSEPGGMPAGVIPKFRLSDKAVNIDVNAIIDLGVIVEYNMDINKEKFKQLTGGSDYVYIAAGAQIAKTLPIEGANNDTLTDPLKLLLNVKNNPKYDIGNRVAIVGGGNTAMDAARTAKRLVGAKGSVTIVYRRTIKQMPADNQEILDAIAEGIKVTELISPVKIEKQADGTKKLYLERMKLGEKGKDGRRRPVAIPESEFSEIFDTVIPAVGQDLDIDFADESDLQSGPGKFETKLNNVFVGGDTLRGASSLINAIGDGRKTAQEIINRENKSYDTRNKEQRKTQTVRYLMLKKAQRTETSSENEIISDDNLNFNLLEETFTKEQAQKEAERCLLCDEVCNICTTVCPNFALQAYSTEPKEYKLQKLEDGKIKKDTTIAIKQEQQIIHIADWCNQCGNCDTFCPTADAPYKVKPHLYLSEKEYKAADTGYFYNERLSALYSKSDGAEFQFSNTEEGYDYHSNGGYVQFNKSDFRIKKHNGIEDINFKQALEMKHIFEAAKQLLA